MSHPDYKGPGRRVTAAREAAKDLSARRHGELDADFDEAVAREKDGCPFCRIARRDPDHQIEVVTGDSFVITPLNPVTSGHKLVIPLDHVADAVQNPRVTAGVMRDTAVYLQRMDVGDCNVITSVGTAATQTVFHLHVHLVPRRVGDGLALPWTSAALSLGELLKDPDTDTREPS